MPIGSPKHIAITIAGAVSLGSYEAGALYELLEAIRQHNGKVEAEQEGQPIYVDVLTGASAGGMTATILAQKLLFDGPSFVSADGNPAPWNNPLYETWVQRITLAELLDTTDAPIAEGGDPALLSLLSSQLIETIAREKLLSDTVNGEIADHGEHAAISPAGEIRLGMALTNLTGVNYGLPMISGGSFQYTRFEDSIRRRLTRADRTVTTWQEVANAAVASGAFPVAFRTKDLTREYADYADDQPLGWTGGTRKFNYSDGGILQNQPLGMAKQLMDDADGHQHSENRFYLFVSPNPMSDQVDATLNESDVNMVRVVGRIGSVYMGQAMFQDWVEADAVNARVARLDEQARLLAVEIASGAVSAEELASRRACHESLLNLLYSSQAKGNGGQTSEAEFDGTESRAQATARLTRQYSEELQQVGAAETEGGQMLLSGIHLLEKSAGLSELDYMEIYGVVIDPGKLAGAGIAAFVGFFDESYRRHDYECGRERVQALIAQLNAQASGQGSGGTGAAGQTGRPELGPIHYTPVPVQIDPTLDGLRLNQINPEDVHTLKEGLTRRVNQILVHELENPVERYPAQWGADLALGVVLNWEFSRDAQG